MKKNRIYLIAAVLLLTGMPSMTALAGDINENEAGVLEAAGGTFDYNGKTYVSRSEYMSMLQSKLAEDGVDLTAEQAAEMISMIYANVKTGVRQGYLQEVGGGGVDDQPIAEKPKVNGDNSPEENSRQGQPEDAAAASQSTENPEKEIGSESGIKKFDMDELAKKDPGQRTKEEESAYQTYLAKQAIDQLNVGGDAKSQMKKDQKIGKNSGEMKTELFLSKYGMIIPVIFLAIFMLGDLLYLVRKTKKIAAARKHLPEAYIDMHSHILPNVDDGARDMETTMKLVDNSYSQGVRCMIATPHYHSGHNRCRQEEIMQIYETARQRIAEKYSDFTLLLGNEVYYTDGTIERLNEGRALPLAGTKYVLVEFGPNDSYGKIQKSVIELLRELYIPVIAHVERYKNVASHMERIKELHRMGALLQMNAVSVKKYKKLLKSGYIDLLATDCHDMDRRTPNLQRGVQQMCAFASADMIEDILYKKPNLILKGVKDEREIKK